MTNDELNRYIFHYLTEDKTKSAIMLTGDWGTGKSYYIQNELKPFLEKEENGKHQCVIVSLYGLKGIDEISKSIYLEDKTEKLNVSSQTLTAGKIFAKTIIKNFAGHYGVDLSMSDADLNKLYESVDLSGKLVVLEDLERSSIDILEVLGYVNNLVEQDGVKVLLVANEDKFIEYDFVEGNRQETVVPFQKSQIAPKKVFASNTRAYFATKEKTISDTIYYENDYDAAIREIIREFDNVVLSGFDNTESANDILDIMALCSSYNLRSFIFACQKAADIFAKLGDEHLADSRFVRAIFFGIIFFSLRRKAGNIDPWRTGKYFSIELGSEKHPLFRFCYDYIVQQKGTLENVEETYKAYLGLLLYDKDKSNNDSDILTLKNYHAKTEKEVLGALQRIEKRLDNPDDISFCQYGTIAVYSIILKELLDYDIQTIKTRLVQNLEGRGDKLDVDHIFRTILDENCSDEQMQEYTELREDMEKSLKIGDCSIPNFDYLPEQSGAFYDYVLENTNKIRGQFSFAQQLDICRLAEMFKNGTAEQKDNIRAAFFTVYRSDIVHLPFVDDRESLTELLKRIEDDSKGDVGDKIQKKQYAWFIAQLEKVIQKLS